MKINCRHGYLEFSEQKAGEISSFMSQFGLEIEYVGYHWILAALVDAPRFSIAGGDFLGCPTTETFEGHPAEVMRQNGIIYSLITGQCELIESVTQSVSLLQSGSYFVADGLIQAGSVMDGGLRVTDYAGHYVNTRFRYSEVAGV